MDGTAGRRGPRGAGDAKEGSEPFPEPHSYLQPAEAAAYDAWTAWSHKPAGMDHVLPSKDYFSLGKMRPFMGDVNEPGVIAELIKVRPRPYDSQGAASAPRAPKKGIHAVWMMVTCLDCGGCCCLERLGDAVVESRSRALHVLGFKPKAPTPYNLVRPVVCLMEVLWHIMLLRWVAGTQLQG